MEIRKTVEIIIKPDDFIEYLKQIKIIGNEYSVCTRIYLQNGTGSIVIKLTDNSYSDLKNTDIIIKKEISEEEVGLFLEKKIIDLDLTVRTLNCLKAADIYLVKHLLEIKEFDLLQQRNFGKKGISEIKNLLAVYGLELKKENT
jgi:hypothetical protein